MPEGQPLPGQLRATPPVEAQAAASVKIDDLVRLPPLRLARLLLDRAAEDPTLLHRLYATVDDMPRERPAEPPAIVGHGAAMRHVAALVERFEKTDEPVLITGESGTGKELLARAIHQGSRRSGGPFVAVNCAAIPAGLVASELFGHEKGSFTGAGARNTGQIEHANGGTLFLDEIGDMPVDLQGHLLRFLQEGQIRRVGGRDPVDLNVRIVSATNVRLRQAIAEGRFREDLFYRLNVLTLPVPPLRERREDIPGLAEHFLRAAARDFDREVDGFTREAMAALVRHWWPGNVRELMSVIRRAVVVGDGRLIDTASLHGLDEKPLAQVTAAPRPGSAEERAALLATLERTRENVSSAAEALCVSRVTLYRMLRRHGIVLKRGFAAAPVAREAREAHA